MPPLPKPAFKPEWATVIGVYGGRTNGIEPPAGRKPEGWQYLEKPPRNYENWLWHYVGEWTTYLESMTAAGKMPATKVVAAVNASDQWRQSADLVLGAADNQALLISNLIAALPAGGRILFSDGTFTLRQPIVVVGNGIVIQGQGPTTLFLNAAQAGGCFAFEVTSYAARLLDFYCCSDLGVAGGVHSNGIHVDNALGVLLQRLYLGPFHGGPSTHGAPNIPKGVGVFSEGSRWYACDVQINHRSVAVGASAEDVWAVAGSSLLDRITMLDEAWGGGSVAPASSAMYLDGGIHVVRDCYASNMAIGITADRLTAGLINGFRGESFTANGISIITSSSDVQVSEARINSAAGDGIYIDASSYRCRIQGGEVNTSGVNGIEVAGDGNDIDGMTVYDTAVVGILVANAAGTASQNHIRGCRVNAVGGGGTAGISLATTSEDTSVDDCFVTFCPVGILDAGLRNKVAANHLRSNTTAHIKTVDGAAFNGQITNNQVGTAVDAVINALDVEGDGALIAGNAIGGAAGSLILIRIGGVHNAVIGNSGPNAGSAVYGINQDGVAGATRNYIQSNYMIGVGTTADLRVQGAFTNAISSPETMGGAPDGHTCVDNNCIATSTIV